MERLPRDTSKHNYRSLKVCEHICHIATAFFHLTHLINLVFYILSKSEIYLGTEKFSRVLTYLHSQLSLSTSSSNMSRNAWPEDMKGLDQRGCPNIIPNLTAMPIWYPSSSPSSISAGSRDRPAREIVVEQDLPFVPVLESNYEIIRDEFLAARNVTGNRGFQPYRAPSSTSSSSSPQQDSLGYLATDFGDWNVAYLYLHGINFEENLRLFPKTATLVKSLKRQYHHSFFSALSPSTHVTPHYGPTNKKLRCHLPLLVPNIDNNDSDISETSCRLVVGGEIVRLQEGKCVVFDDSFLHEAYNDNNTEPRVVLIIDFWHPDFTDEEVRFLSYINNAQINSAKRIASEHTTVADGGQGGGEEENTNFFSIIENVKKVCMNNAVDSRLIWGSSGGSQCHTKVHHGNLYDVVDD